MLLPAPQTSLLHCVGPGVANRLDLVRYLNRSSVMSRDATSTPSGFLIDLPEAFFLNQSFTCPARSLRSQSNNQTDSVTRHRRLRSLSTTRVQTPSTAYFSRSSPVFWGISASPASSLLIHRFGRSSDTTTDLDLFIAFLVLPSTTFVLSGQTRSTFPQRAANWFRRLLFNRFRPVRISQRDILASPISQFSLPAAARSSSGGISSTQFSASPQKPPRWLHIGLTPKVSDREYENMSEWVVDPVEPIGFSWGDVNIASTEILGNFSAHKVFGRMPKRKTEANNTGFSLPLFMLG